MLKSLVGQSDSVSVAGPATHVKTIAAPSRLSTVKRDFQFRWHLLLKMVSSTFQHHETVSDLGARAHPHVLGEFSANQKRIGLALWCDAVPPNVA